MDAPVLGEYTIIHGNLNDIEFSNGWNIVCIMNQLAIGRLVHSLL
jgi:hypothetical protein